MTRSTVLLFALLSVCYGCSCDSPAPTQKELFCSADYVATYTMYKDVGNSTHLLYVGVAEDIFKSDGFIQSGSNIRIITSSEGSACGVSWLEDRKKYLLNGNRCTRGLCVNSCGQMAKTEWKDVSADLKQSLEDGVFKPCK